MYSHRRIGALHMHLLLLSLLFSRSIPPAQRLEWAWIAWDTRVQFPSRYQHVTPQHASTPDKYRDGHKTESRRDESADYLTSLCITIGPPLHELAHQQQVTESATPHVKQLITLLSEPWRRLWQSVRFHSHVLHGEERWKRSASIVIWCTVVCTWAAVVQERTRWESSFCQYHSGTEPLSTAFGNIYIT